MPKLASVAAGLIALILGLQHEARATHRPAISGTGTATVDGILAPGEWDRAATVDFRAALPAAEGGGSVPARAFVMNDTSNLYLALRVARDTYGHGAEFSWFFDRANTGFRQNGDDSLFAQVWRSSGLIFYDGYRWLCPGATSINSAHCGAAHDWIQVEGAPPPGTSDGGAAVREGSGAVVFEMVHPLDSADDAHDFSLTAGSLIGYSLSVRFMAACMPDPGCWVDTSAPDGHIGISPGAALSVTARATPARVRVGRTLTYTMVVRAAPTGAAAAGARLEAELPANVRLASVRTTAGRCTGRQFVDCELGTLAPGSAATVTIRTQARRSGAARLNARVATTSYTRTAGAARATATVVRGRSR